MKIHLIHGIHTSKGSRRMAAAKPYLARAAGLHVDYFEYGDLKAIQTRFWNPGIAKRFARTVAEGDVVVAHSNGNPIAIRAMRDFGARPRGLVVLNGALEPAVELPECLEWIHVYYNEHDDIVPLTELPFFSQFLFDPLWGEMGRKGYTGTDPRVRNFDCWNVDEWNPIAGHSNILDPENRVEWFTLIGARIRERSPTNSRP